MNSSDYLEYLVTVLIEQRNEIFDNIFKYYNPYYQAKLKKIDAKIDCIESILYERREKITIEDIMKMSDEAKVMAGYFIKRQHSAPP